MLLKPRCRLTVAPHGPTIGHSGLTPPPPGRPANTKLTDTAVQQSTSTARTTRPQYMRHEYSRLNRGKQQLRRGVAVPHTTPQARRAQNGMPAELPGVGPPQVGTN